MVLLLNAAFMFVCSLVGLGYNTDSGTLPLLLSAIITGIVGYFPLVFVPAQKHITSREGYIIVLTSWIGSCLMGMLPYLIWGGEFSVVNAWFESTSGFTTTGATILQDVEALPHSLLMWRAVTHWIGGVGVVLFTLVVLPSIGRSRMTLSAVEISSIAKDNFRYNTKKILSVILYVYLGLTALQTISLYCAGMNLFDAIAHSFSTISTGGFSTKNDSIMAFNSLAIEIVVMVFMLLAGIHFGLIYTTIRPRKQKNSKTIFTSDVSKYFLLCCLVFGILIALNLLFCGTYGGFWESIRYSLFQTISYATTTGFASINAAGWPAFAVLILTVLSIQCAMAGSTTGGLKADRILLLIKSIKQRILKLQHPNAIKRIKLGGNPQDDFVIQGAMILIGFYILAVVISTAFLTLFNVDLMTSFSASVASIGNVGPGFGEVSNLANFDHFNPVIKLWLSGIMLFGRLELFGLIHLFMIHSWK